MTFLCTKNGELVPGEREHGGNWPWPQPWAFRCDECGRIFEYGCVVLEKERWKSPAPPSVREVRSLGADTHRCAFCEGYVEPEKQPEQLVLGAAA